MKAFKTLVIFLVIIFSSCQHKEPITFYDTYFEDATLRIDYFHSGDANSEVVVIDDTYQYDSWAGSKLNVIDRLDYGVYFYKIYDSQSRELIYSKGFDSYFKEYQYTAVAIEGIQKQFHESAIIPLPKSKFEFALEKRDKFGKLHEVFITEIDPAEANSASVDTSIHVYTSLDNGDPNIKADVLIVGEGYTAEEEQKFQDDLQRFTEIFFRAEPCKSYKSCFNIRGVLKASEDSGVDEPRANIDKNTAVSATFNSLGSERYLLTEDNKSLRDIAGHAPYDALYIMVNHSRYGGGGIYNFYCVYTSDNDLSDYLMVHEFGHSFFGLADEYYSSSTSYVDFYPPGYEPHEPNITALLDPENLKWMHLASKGLKIPTPWGKQEYDSLDNEWQVQRQIMNERIMALKKSKASKEEIKAAIDQYNKENTERNEEKQAILDNPKFAGKVGAFEGAGYASTGLYRPSINCIMFSHVDYFCPVCEEAMAAVIKSYAE